MSDRRVLFGWIIVVGSLVAGVLCFPTHPARALSQPSVYLPVIANEPSPTPTATPGPPRTFVDDFSDPSTGWPTTPIDGIDGGQSYVMASRGYVGGTYQIFFPSYAARATAGRGLITGDFQAELDVWSASGVDGENGFFFDSSNSGEYDFECGTIGGQSGVDLARYDAVNQTWTHFGGLSMSAVRPAGAVNHLAITRTGAVITLFVNGQQVGQVSDGTYLSGEIGLSAQAARARGFDARFDNLRVTYQPVPTG